MHPNPTSPWTNPSEDSRKEGAEEDAAEGGAKDVDEAEGGTILLMLDERYFSKLVRIC